jgi:hypothetical protein
MMQNQLDRSGITMRPAPWPGIISRMIETSLSPTLVAIVLRRVSGVIDQQQAEQGAAEALRFVQQLSSEHKLINLVLD